MSNIFGIGISGLQAAQAGLLTTSHNISNANTPGYSRQEVTLGTREPMYSGAGFFGQGVDATGVRRVYSDFLASQALQAQSQASHLETYSTQLAALSTLFADSSSGLAPALTGFFAGVNTVATNPSDVPSRQALLSSGEALVGRFQQLHQQLEESRDGINAQITNSVATINSLATSIGDLNKRIVAGLASSFGLQAPNDLMDQRDALMTQLNEQLATTSIAQSDGSVNVSLPNGQALVVGMQSYQLTAGPGDSDPRNIEVGLKSGSSTSQFHSLDLKGGVLGGLLAYRDDVLGSAENALGRTALVIAQSFNDQHKLGLDLTGQPGGNFFITPTPNVQAALSNTGSGAVDASVVDASSLTTSDYQLLFDGTNYSLTRLSDDTTQTFASLPRTVDGVTVTSSGAPAAGDRFLIQPTRYAAGGIDMAISDPKKIAAAAPVRIDTATANAGSGRISSTRVDATYLAAPLSGPSTLTFDGMAGTLSGFPATQAVTVTVGTTSTTYAAGTPVPYTPGATISFGGIALTLAGAPADGDTYTVRANTGAAGDSRNAALLAALQSSNIAANNTTTIAGTYAQIVSFIGTAAHQAKIESSAQDSILLQSQQAAQSVSGVNLDEEAANLQRYQQAYQAAGKVLALAASLFDTILDITRG